MAGPAFKRTGICNSAIRCVNVRPMTAQAGGCANDPRPNRLDRRPALEAQHADVRRLPPPPCPADAGCSWELMMSEYADLCHRLRTRPNDAPMPTEQMHNEAAAAIAKLEAERDALREALELLVGEPLGGDDHDGWRSHDTYRAVITWHDRRKARAALDAATHTPAGN